MQRLSDLRYRHSKAWSVLAQQPFFIALRDNMVSLRAIQRWMAQNYFFVEGLMRFQAIVLQRAPQSHRLILAQAVVSTVEELDWLYHQDLDLQVEPHPATLGYLTYLRELEAEPYPLLAVLNWALQRAFLDVWVSVRLEEGPLAEKIAHWTAPEFQALLHDLGVLALEVSAETDPALLDNHIERVLAHEKAIWQMAWEYAQES